MQCLDDAPRRGVLGAIIDDVELLVALVVIGLRVRVAIDDLDRPLGILELHLLQAVELTKNVLLAFPLARRRVITVGLLLLLLVELLHNLFDLLALLGAMAPKVVHWAPWPTLLAIGGLA
jgi:hypothetical protein